MFHYVCITICLVLGSQIQLSCSTEVHVKNAAQELCLYANLSVSFAVTYETSGKKHLTVVFLLPDNVNTTGSTCDQDTSTLKIGFGNGHSWSIIFKKENATYEAHQIVFSYNLGDGSIFKDSSSNETKSVTLQPSISDVAMDTYYSCKSHDVKKMDLVVQTSWDVSLQAFIINGNRSEKATVCARDRTTTPAPTSRAANTTTPVPSTHVTNTTTPVPTTRTTNTTTSTTSASPTTPSPLPKTGNYSIKDVNNNSFCLLALMGLQMSFKDGAGFQKINIVPDSIKPNGTCGVNGSDATLELRSVQANITFTFQEDGKKFFLHAVNVTIEGTHGIFSAANTNLSLWEASLGSSYMCNKEQSYNITDQLSMNTFSLRVQPFNVQGYAFSTAHECAMDDTSILIPVVVGAALLGLIIIVLIVYAIGRRKTSIAYQTL
ncbi:hypothetical protein GJAV_G00201190 [Gymnothorax javanicus]|nr:hypothetical protein GJAV_G00201190 [Gymnothorax javanicus]